MIHCPAMAQPTPSDRSLLPRTSRPFIWMAAKGRLRTRNDRFLRTAAGWFRRIAFSNGSRGRGSSGYRRLGMPAFSARSLALDGVSWDRAARLKTQSAGDAACYKIHAVVCSLPRASLLAGARCGLLSQWSIGLRRDERRSVPQHGVHDDGEATRQSDARLAHG